MTLRCDGCGRDGFDALDLYRGLCAVCEEGDERDTCVMKKTSGVGCDCPDDGPCVDAPHVRTAWRDECSHPGRDEAGYCVRCQTRPCPTCGAGWRHRDESGRCGCPLVREERQRRLVRPPLRGDDR